MPSDTLDPSSCQDDSLEHKKQQLERRRQINRQAQRRFRHRNHQVQKRKLEQEQMQTSGWHGDDSYFPVLLPPHGTQMIQGTGQDVDAHFFLSTPVTMAPSFANSIGPGGLSLPFPSDFQYSQSPALLASPHDHFDTSYSFQDSALIELTPPPSIHSGSQERPTTNNKASPATQSMSTEYPSRSPEPSGIPSPLSSESWPIANNANLVITPGPSSTSSSRSTTVSSLPRHAPEPNSDREPEGLSKALFLAAKNGHTGVVRALVEKGGGLNAVDEDGNSALHLAILGQHRDVVAFLLKQNVYRQGANAAGLIPLTLAAKIGFEEGVRMLLESA